MSSKVRFFCLSPKSQSKRLENMRQSRKNMTKQVKRYRKKFSVLMSDTHSSDLDKLMERVESTPMGRKKLKNVWRKLKVSDPAQDKSCVRYGIPTK